MDACKLNDLVYIAPQMEVRTAGCEYVPLGDPPSDLMLAAGINESDKVLLVVYWEDQLAPSSGYGHDFPTTFIYYLVDPGTDEVRIAAKQDIQTFLEKNGEAATVCTCQTAAPEYNKEYFLDLCGEFDYCNPPRILHENLRVTIISTGLQYFIPLPLE